MRAILLFVLCWSVPALAIPTTYHFTGTVNTVWLISGGLVDPAQPYVDDGDTVLNGDVIVSGSFTFDFDSVPVGSDGTVPGGMIDWNAATLGQSFNKRPNITFQYIELSSDSLGYTDEIADGALGPDVFTLDLLFAGDPLQSQFIGGSFTFVNMSRGVGYILGSIDSLSVPEPSTLWLLAAGLFGLLGVRRIVAPVAGSRH